jgi:hypothetical protein
MPDNQKKNAPSDVTRDSRERRPPDEVKGGGVHSASPRGSDPDHLGASPDESKPGAEQRQELGPDAQERLARRPDRGQQH